MAFASLSTLANAIRSRLGRNGRRPPAEPPLRDELFSIVQLEAHARLLAADHHDAAVTARGGDPLRVALRRNEQTIASAWRTLGEDVRRRVSISPAAEWLLDNMYVVTEQIREVRQDLPRGYYRQLPKLRRGPLAGLPRVYAIALELIAHTDGRIDAETLLRFLIAYQSATPLTMGELWAVAIMLRIGLIENLSRLAAVAIEARQMRIEADSWAERIFADALSGADHETVLRELAERHPRLPLPLAAQLLRRLRAAEGEHDIGPFVAWLEGQPVLPYSTVEALIHAEHQRQAANQLSVGHTITSMRTLSSLDWAAWFEQVSHVEQVLRRDPDGVYGHCIFETRDRYRHVIEDLARRSGHGEDEVVRRLLARAHGAPADDPRRRHVGYYLVDAGLPEFEAALGYRPPPAEALRRGMLRHPTELYIGALGAITAGLTAGGLRLLNGRHAAGPARRAAAAALLALPASALAGELVNRSLTRLLPPRTLPRLDLRRGVPAELRTIVVVPTLLLTPDSISRQLESLEVLHLANDDPHLHLALLTDFADAPQASMPEDAALLNLALEGVRQLNERYGADRFLLLHRRRLWNERQGVWMGWERKRGKLEEFNRLLDGAADTSYETSAGDLGVLPLVRYVITLDADTQLPRDAAQLLIGTLAHPLNQAVIDPASGRVVEGYGILQPRIGIDLPSASRSRFARIFAGNVGIDPYTTAVSDVYMDLFGEGIYAGKGIYDPAVLRAALHERFPENTLLSHDLIEGCYARAALLSDVELLDSYPASYAAWAARQHRWVRGDWQIAAWLLPVAPSAVGPRPNVLSAIARFKLYDNLRRSLVPPATVAALALGWLGLPRRPLAWSCLALGHLAAPLLFQLLDGLIALAKEPRNRGALRAHGRELELSALRLLLNTAFLPDQAAVNLHAIGLTLWRMAVSRRWLLEWETADQAQRRLQRSHQPVLSRTFPGLALAAGLAALRRQPPAGLPAAAPILADWLAAPALAAWLDRPLTPRTRPLTAAERLLLRRVARATWAYFERFVRAEANYLAPDNFQETPRPVIADRTSPTNIGLQLLADLAAYDFGYLGLIELTERTERVLATMARMQRHRGHWLNWYDTRTLAVLPPAYISTVDSGNLAAYLLTLRQGFLALADRPLAGPRQLEGLADTLALLREGLPADAAEARRTADELAGAIAPPASPTAVAYRALLAEVARRADQLVALRPDDPWAVRLAAQARSILRDLEALPPGGQPGAPPSLEDLGAAGAELRERHQAIAATCAAWVEEMEFAFLYDDRRRVFVIGYNLGDDRRDGSHYDLLASESRLGSYLAIAKGDVSQEHWFRLGRPLAAVGLRTALISWSGTMFEYLMPLLVMRRYPATLLDATYEAAVDRQIAYGRERGVPWGISESAYNARDLQMNYQYRAFGVPGLGLKPGLADDLVVAPYATMLALPVRPAAAMTNLDALIEAGMFGAYGLYEAIDYTPGRMPPGASSAIIRSFMVHHQGMSLLTLANLLHDEAMQRRFHGEPIVRATEPLLQERLPEAEPVETAREAAAEPLVSIAAAPTARRFATPATAVPFTHLLSNGRYSVMLTNAGGGASSYDDMAVTRWRADTTRDGDGSFIYIRDARSSAAWSAAYQPTRHSSAGYQVTYRLDKAEYRQRVAGILTHTEVVVSPEDNVELRRVTLTNVSEAPRELELTSYAEVVLAPAAADEAHPAFSNLFVETAFAAEHAALLASRRPRSATARPVWAVHAVVVRGHTIGAPQYDTDRASFIGRGRDLRDPQALHGPLAGRAGAVLDPIFSLRRRVRVVPGGSAQITFVTGVAESREQALALAAKMHDPSMITRAFELAWTQSQVELRHLNIDADQAHRFQRLASAALYLDGRRRARPELLARNALGQPALWAYGISGDYPIILVRIGANDELTLVQELLRAHEFWRLKRLTVDLVLLNEDSGGYAQGRQEQILALVRGGHGASLLGARGGIFLLRADIMPEQDLLLLEAVARAVLSTRRGSLAQHLRRGEADAGPPPPRPLPPPEPDAPLPPLELAPRTPYGGFTPDGREYVIDLAPGRNTPAPWANVVANERFGFIVTERGSGYTWSENSRENRLTPWSNDPVRDPSGEAIYLRDEASGAYWSPTVQPDDAGHVRARHGFGYSSFERRSGAIASLLTLFVPPDDSVKIYRLRLTNHGDAPRQLSATFYVEWVLGVFRRHMAPYIVTEADPARGALLARNAYNVEFAPRAAFIATSAAESSWTGDRAEFIGRNGDLARPAAMGAPNLSGRAGAGFDPCGALRCAVELAPGEERELIFLLGQGADSSEAAALVDRYRDPAAVEAAFSAATGRWRELLETVQVQTPRPELDPLLNGWLLYQTLVCRVWARSAFYQSGGAYGFRDQLQDVMALTHAAPGLTRAQILRAASRQFVEGDVQHWWHPPTGRGIRTNFSDDYLWLPFVTAHYVAATGDAAILDEGLPFLEDRPLAPGEDEYYDLPRVSNERASLYEHCARAVEYGMGRMGAHGLPLMGSGDWNDGMNRVGHEGKGESVWVGWFLQLNLVQLAALADGRGDGPRARRYRDEAARLGAAIERHAWDGSWYLRAFYDDGTPLGSAQSDECQIDSLSQSWAVIGGMGDGERARRGMAAVDERLIDREAGLIQLFTPPFDKTDHDPGYIKGYVPGVRENGGQYTHAAIWVIWAWTLLGDGARAGALLDMINPVCHAAADTERYMVEPYTIAADVYRAEGHCGRGGWTWYTGSAGWLYRLGVEQILGLRRAGDRLQIAPCLPPDWPGYSATYRYGAASYRISVAGPQPPGARPQLRLDGEPLPDGGLPLADDGAEHEVSVSFPRAEQGPPEN